MSNFFGEFSYALGVKNFFEIFFENILASALKSCIKWSYKTYNFLFLKLNRNFKHELSPSKPLLCSTQSLILGSHMDYVIKIRLIKRKISEIEFIAKERFQNRLVAKSSKIWRQYSLKNRRDLIFLTIGFSYRLIVLKPHSAKLRFAEVKLRIRLQSSAV